MKCYLFETMRLVNCDIKSKNNSAYRRYEDKLFKGEYDGENMSEIMSKYCNSFFVSGKYRCIVLFVGLEKSKIILLQKEKNIINETIYMDLIPDTKWKYDGFSWEKIH